MTNSSTFVCNEVFEKIEFFNCLQNFEIFLYIGAPRLQCSPSRQNVGGQININRNAEGTRRCRSDFIKCIHFFTRIMFQ